MKADTNDLMRDVRLSERVKLNMLTKSNQTVRSVLVAMIILSATLPGMAFKGPVRRALSVSKSDNKPVKQEKKQAADSAEIPCRSWYRSDRLPYAVLLCLHGFGMNMNSYNEFGKHMSELGIPTYAIDIRGFGCWQDKKQELDFEGAIKDVQTALIAIRKVHPDVPLILLGESMGGSLALQAMAENQTLADGLICSVPGDDRFGEKGVDLKVALGILTGSRKSIKVGNGIVNQITDDPKLRNELDVYKRQEFQSYRFHRKTPRLQVA